MKNPITHDDGSDSADLQALFDSIAAAAPPASPNPLPEPERAGSNGDSDELQALFDSVMQEQRQPAATSPGSISPATRADPQEAVFNSLGLLARQLHDSLRGLGVDKLLEDSARQIPDARQRLAYIAQMTEQAASRVLNATDIAKPVQDELIAHSQALSQRWEKMFANQLSVDEFKALAADTRGYFAQAPARLKLTNDQLLEIMLAQDFQDLTGQVIKKVVELVQGLETQLLGLLLEAMPEQRKAEAPEGLLNGPVVSSEGRIDVVSNQSQVDELLESLGF
ncbi:MAG: protein phosphatase CheZ [Rhodocyclales bacterium]|nr:protein phosphatase CheZ [Rhodocyclales bacterium]